MMVLGYLGVDLNNNSGLGFLIIQRLSQQLEAELKF